jgi:hypothetical protein
MIPTSGLTEESLSKSFEGAQKIAPHADSIREQVFEAIKAAGEEGITDRELQQALGLKGDTQRPRRWELWIAGRVKAKRDENGNVIYKKVGVRSKQLVWVAGQECVCPTCGHVYTKTFTKFKFTPEVLEPAA